MVMKNARTTSDVSNAIAELDMELLTAGYKELDLGDVVDAGSAMPK